MAHNEEPRPRPPRYLEIPTASSAAWHYVPADTFSNTLGFLIMGTGDPVRLDDPHPLTNYGDDVSTGNPALVLRVEHPLYLDRFRIGRARLAKLRTFIGGGTERSSSAHKQRTDGYD
jgi:hypothetical protein